MRKLFAFLLCLVSFAAFGASGFTNIDTDWYIRAGGAELNSGGFDSYRGGTNYADSDTAHVLIDNATITATSAGTTLTFTGGFTPNATNDPGNTVRISAGTGCTADYYLITAANAGAGTWTLDRTAGASCTAIVARMGGAFAHIRSLAASVSFGSAPILYGPLTAGNNVYIRGTNGLDPSSNDYDWADGVYTLSADGGNLNTATGNIRFYGYPAGNRPRIRHWGLLIQPTSGNTGGHYQFSHFKFFQKSDCLFTTHSVIGDNGSISYYDVIFDADGCDSPAMNFGNGSNGAGQAVGFEIRNSGGGAAGTKYGVYLTHGGGLLFGGWIHGQRGYGVQVNGVYGALDHMLINSNLLDGYYDDETDSSHPIPYVVMNTTVDANTNSNMRFASKGIQNNLVVNTILSNAPSGKYAMEFADSLALNTEKYVYSGYNTFYNNGTSGTTNFNGSPAVWSLNPTQDGAFVGDITTNPSYTNAGGNNFTTGAAMKCAGMPAPPNLKTPVCFGMGAIR